MAQSNLVEQEQKQIKVVIIDNKSLDLFHCCDANKTAVTKVFFHTCSTWCACVHDVCLLFVVTYILIQVHAVLFGLPHRHCLLLLFFLVPDALDEIGKRGRSGMHVVLACWHVARSFLFPFRAFGQRLSICGQSLIMRCKIVPVNRLDQDWIICNFLIATVIEANGFVAKCRRGRLRAHRDKGTLLVRLGRLPGEAIVEDLLPSVCQLICSHSSLIF